MKTRKLMLKKDVVEQLTANTSNRIYGGYPQTMVSCMNCHDKTIYSNCTCFDETVQSKCFCGGTETRDDRCGTVAPIPPTLSACCIPDQSNKIVCLNTDFLCE